MNAVTIPNTRMGRLCLCADALGAPVPVGLPADLLSEDEAPAREVLRFCLDHGASLDFIYLGDVKALIRYTACAMKGQAA